MKSISIWLKNNWVVVLIIFAVIFVVYRQTASASLYDKLMEDYNTQAKVHNEEIKEIDLIHKNEVNRLEELISANNERIQEIEKDYQKKLSDITRQSKIKRNILIEESKKNPKILTEAVRKTFGIPIYNPSKVGGSK